jgi:hypothetical protein
MMACIIMYNMIVEDESEENNDFNYDQMGERVIVSHDDAPELDAFITNYHKIKDKETHTQLQEDLIEHLCKIILIYIIILVQSNFLSCVINNIHFQHSVFLSQICQESIFYHEMVVISGIISSRFFEVIMRW